MTPDTTDTIVAIASARGAATRGVIRLSGPDSVAIAERLGGQSLPVARPTRLAGQTLVCPVAGTPRRVPADLGVWPDQRSYTRQPSVEIHTVGSPPLLNALVGACLTAGARLAEPGEFTLRAFLAGRLDLTQAEGVLAVIDAPDDARLAAALEQLAGGLSTPLHALRAELLGLLADLEAGLDFVEEEDIRFVDPEELRARLAMAAEHLAEAAEKLHTHDSGQPAPRVVVAGPPNVGKSRLFNAIVERFGAEEASAKALVADQVGVTRDALAAVVVVEGFRFQLIDTAGDDSQRPADALDAAARRRLADVRRDADLLLECLPANQVSSPAPQDRLGVATMGDRYAAPSSHGWLATSAATGLGVDALATAIVSRLAGGTPAADLATQTAARSRASLLAARDALSRAAEAAAIDAGEELVSLELRTALDALGRVVGEVVTDEVLGEIFGRFCIGK